MLNDRKTRVLIVDDSAIVRKILTEALAGEADIEVVGAAPDPYVARDKILALHPDVLTLDIEMPRMDGLTFLKKLMHFNPLPVVVISSLAQPSCKAAIEALEFGAVEVLAKPGGPYSVGELRNSLANKIRAASHARLRPAVLAPPAPPAAPVAPAALAASAGPVALGSSKAPVAPGVRPMGSKPAAPPAASAAVRPRIEYSSPPAPDSILAIGASTGGTEAIASIMKQMPAASPAIVITQHIPPEFSRAFANRLNDMCAVEVREAVDGDALRPGLALVAPGDFHMVLRKNGGRYFVTVKTGPRVCYQRPSVDVLFSSVAEAAGAAALGVILTGMGSDGAQGMLKMHHAGAYTIAQDEASCVVFGMPREAIHLGGVDQVLALAQIPAAIVSARRGARKAAGSVAVDGRLSGQLQ